MVSMSSAVAAVRLSGRMCWKESLSGIGEAVLGEEVGLDHLCPEAPSHGILNDPKIGFYEDFRLLRQKLLDVTQHISMLLPENFRHLQAGDGGNREGPAKKAPCGWPGRAHRAENEAEGMEGQSSCWAASMAAVWGVFVGTFYKLAYPAAHALAASTGLRKSGRPRSV